MLQYSKRPHNIMHRLNIQCKDGDEDTRATYFLCTCNEKAARTAFDHVSAFLGSVGVKDMPVAGAYVSVRNV